MNIKSIKITALTLAAAALVSVNTQAAGTPAILNQIGHGSTAVHSNLSTNQMAAIQGEFNWKDAGKKALKALPYVSTVVTIGSAASNIYKNTRGCR